MKGNTAMKRILAVCITALLAVGGLAFGSAAASADAPTTVGVFGTVSPWSSETNSTSFWEDYGEHDNAQCYKHEGSNDHGSITDGGKTVTLNPFGADWPGDHWELLVIKGGNVSNNIIVHPEAGVAYASPLNNSGNQSEVSHWIVCKGTTPDEPDPEDATASIDITPGTCTTAGSAQVSGLANVTWDGVLDLTPGTHTETFTAIAEHLFPGGGTEKVIEYTVPGKNVQDCPTNQECEVYSTVHTTDLATWDLSKSRSQGDSNLVPGALHVYTWADDDNGSPDQRKAAGYYDAADFLLSGTGDLNIAWTGTSPEPGGQLVVDLDNNGSIDGILVFEEVYGANLWLSSIAPGFDTTGAPSVGGGGGSINGTLDQYLAVWPDAKVLAVGYSLGSGVTGDGLISKITAGCVDYTFGIPAGPDNKRWEKVKEGEPDCEAGTVEVTTLYFGKDAYWDEQSQSWLYGEKFLIEKDVDYRDVTPEDCPAPEPILTDKVTSIEDCDAKTVTTITSYFRSDPVWNEETLVWEYGDPVKYDEDREVRAATIIECPIELAFTGGSVDSNALFAGIGALALGGVVAFGAYLFRRRTQ